MAVKKATEKKVEAKVEAKPKVVNKGPKAKVLSKTGQPKADLNLPAVFETEFRPDLILRAFVAEQSWERQPYGPNPRSGYGTTADYYSRRREYYRMTVNRGMSRLPRVKIPGGGLGRVMGVPHSKGGNRAHPPKVEKIWEKKMNEKEWILALKSAIAATLNEELVTGVGRNHKVKDLAFPLIVEDSFEQIDKTSDVYDAFEKMGLADDIDRASNKKIKAGRARTAKMKLRKSVLIIVSNECNLIKSARNITGVDVVEAEALNISLLAPGGNPGRLTIWTESAIEKISS